MSIYLLTKICNIVEIMAYKPEDIIHYGRKISLFSEVLKEFWKPKLFIEFKQTKYNSFRIFQTMNYLSFLAFQSVLAIQPNVQNQQGGWSVAVTLDVTVTLTVAVAMALAVGFICFGTYSQTIISLFNLYSRHKFTLSCS